MRETFTKIGVVIVFLLLQVTSNAQKRIYVANDDHTDYMWTANEIDYDSAFINMLDVWMDYNDQTKLEHPGNYNLQSKWNCDGTFWVKAYKKYRTPAQFSRLIDQIKNGQITVPYSPLITTYGGVPAEAVLRGMYYAGSLERQYNLRFEMAAAMENQTLPLGMASLWKGAGAKYCWYGVCDCYTAVPGLTNRQNQIYWYKGMDTSKLLLKWYNLANGGQSNFVGGYGEVKTADAAINYLSAKCSTAGYPYTIAGGFGVGWDDFETTNDDLVDAAINNTNASQQIIVSNETDFFHDFETTYGSSLPSVTQTFGNEWDLACASIAEVSAKVKRSLEKLRSAEAMAAIVTNYNPTFAGALDSLKTEAWMALGMYWEHDFGFAGNVSLIERNLYQRRLEATISSYVDQLYNLSRSNLSNLITKSTGSAGLPRFFAFNPLGWKRTGYADYAYTISGPTRVMDVSTNTEVPYQDIVKNNVHYLRVLADSIPSIGYKVYEIQNIAGSFPASWYTTGVNGSFKFVESDSFKVTYTNQGVITSLIDKHNGNKELVAAGGFLNDFGTGNSNTGTSSVENNGPVSVTILTSTTVAPARTTRITLFKNISRIEIDNQITENFTTNKTWTYSFNITSPDVWHEETGAVIKAKLTNNGGHYATQNARYDWSTIGHFASVNDPTGYGVSLSNQDCYFMKLGNSTVSTLNQNTAQLNVLSGGRINSTNSGFPLGIEDQGNDMLFNQRFAITTHTAYSAAADMKEALEHQDSMVCGVVYNPVNFLLPEQYSYVSNDDPGSLIWAVKPAEEGITRGTITRVWNLSDNDATPTLGYNLIISQAKRTTHVETDMNDNAYSARNLLTAIGHNEMKTFRVNLVIIPLAVKSISLEGDKIQGSNILKWINTNEVNVKGYELERSINGVQFTKIADVKAKGAATSNYEYPDKGLNPATPYYYRLKMLNTDNSITYSNIVLIKASSDAYNIVMYPNPVTGVINVNFILDKQTRCTVAIYNAEGKMVKSVSPPLFERGNNYYSMPVKDLPAGEYIFTILAGDKKYVKSFVKENQ
ncbi:T9SS type A sorting domain-containing protein [Ferruginibacter sp. SUN106]|uniref:T9SS type A sorting domain-containing protein n=1 Tax=Ferruginibacter sp. SUN106 TaxID=2978348 RepID=UPI003D3695FB